MKLIIVYIDNSFYIYLKNYWSFQLIDNQLKKYSYNIKNEQPI